jgi:hypothetical protein
MDYLLSEPMFRDMFISSTNALDLFQQLNTPKVILINTAGLGGATESFGRYFVAKLEEAIVKRKFVPNLQNCRSISMLTRPEDVDVLRVAPYGCLSLSWLSGLYGPQ